MLKMADKVFALPGNPKRSRRSAIAWCTLGVALVLWSICGTRVAMAQDSVLDAVKTRGVLRAGIRYDNPPHSFIDAEGRWVGFDVDIAEALAKALGVRLEKVKVDELTRISYLQSGKIDVAVASMSHTIARDRQIDFSQTYFWSTQTFLVKKGEVQTFADLVNKRVGMSRGSHAIGNWQAWLTHHGYPCPPEVIVEFGNKHAAVEAVRHGAVAGYAEDYEMLASFAKHDASLAILDGDAIGVKHDGIGVRENDSRIRDAVNFALQAIETSGEYERIYNRWFGPASETPIPLHHRIEVWPHG